MEIKVLPRQTPAPVLVLEERASTCTTCPAASPWVCVLPPPPAPGRCRRREGALNQPSPTMGQRGLQPICTAVSHHPGFHLNSASAASPKIRPPRTWTPPWSRTLCIRLEQQVSRDAVTAAQPRTRTARRRGSRRDAEPGAVPAAGRPSLAVPAAGSPDMGVPRRTDASVRTR